MKITRRRFGKVAGVDALGIAPIRVFPENQERLCFHAVSAWG